MANRLLDAFQTRGSGNVSGGGITGKAGSPNSPRLVSEFEEWKKKRKPQIDATRMAQAPQVEQAPPISKPVDQVEHEQKKSAIKSAGLSFLAGVSGGLSRMGGAIESTGRVNKDKGFLGGHFAAEDSIGNKAFKALGAGTEKAGNYIKEGFGFGEEMIRQDPGYVQDYQTFRNEKGEFDVERLKDPKVLVNVASSGVGSMAAIVASGALGGLPAAVATAFLTEKGDAVQSYSEKLAEEKGVSIGELSDDDIAKVDMSSTGYGLASAALETIMPAKFLKQIGGDGAGKELVRSIWKRVPISVGTAIVTEGSTEGAQRFTQNVISKLTISDNQELSDGVLDEAIAGALVGGGFGLVGGVAYGQPSNAPQKQIVGGEAIPEEKQGQEIQPAIPATEMPQEAPQGAPQSDLAPTALEFVTALGSNDSAKISELEGNLNTVELSQVLEKLDQAYQSADQETKITIGEDFEYVSALLEDRESKVKEVAGEVISKKSAENLENDVEGLSVSEVREVNELLDKAKEILKEDVPKVTNTTVQKVEKAEKEIEALKSEKKELLAKKAEVKEENPVIAKEIQTTIDQVDQKINENRDFIKQPKRQASLLEAPVRSEQKNIAEKEVTKTYPNKEPEKGIKIYGSISGDTAKLDSIEISKSKQGKGLGTKYVEDFEKWAKENGAKKVSIDAYKKSVGFWEKRGYKLDKDFPVDGGVVQDYKKGTKDLTKKSTTDKESLKGDEKKPEIKEEKEITKPEEKKESVKETEKKAEVGEKKESEEITKKPELEKHAETFKKLRDGKSTLEEYKQGYADIIANKEAVLEELSKKKKDDLLRIIGGLSAYHYKSELKARVVKAAYDSMVEDFALARTVTYTIDGGGMKGTIEKMVAETTENDLQIFAEKVAEARKKREERLAGIKKAVENPETLEEYRNFVEIKGFDALTPAQRAAYDVLISFEAKNKVEAENERKANIQGVKADTEVEIKQTKHTKTGEDLYVAVLSQRVERDVYTQLNTAAKKLGGWYSKFRGAGAIPGFQFKSQEAADQFTAIVKGENVRTDRVEQKVGQRKENTAEKLRTMATKLEEKANESLGRERLSNTSRRAAMAESAEKGARRDLAMAETMKNLAEAIESGKAVHLFGLSTKAQIELLDQTLRMAQNDRGRNEGIKSEKWGEIPFDDETIGYVKSIFPILSVRNLQEAIKIGSEKPGAMRLAEKVKKWLKNVEIEIVRPKTLSAMETLNKLARATGIMDQSYNSLKNQLDDYNRLRSMGIESAPQLRAVLKEFSEFRAKEKEGDKAKSLERSLIGRNFGTDFFPTPKTVAADMVARAEIEEGMSVLEPSAGNGNIAEEIKAAGVNPDVAEISSALREVLEAKEFNLVGNDFLAIEKNYDRIIMNPPFSNNQDIEHVKHAFKILKPGGKLVSIMGEGAFFRQGKTETAFREWIDEIGADVEKLPENTFTDKKLMNTTGTSTRLVVIEKPETAAEYSENLPAMFKSGKIHENIEDKDTYARLMIQRTPYAEFEKTTQKLLKQHGIKMNVQMFHAILDKATNESAMGITWGDTIGGAEFVTQFTAHHEVMHAVEDALIRSKIISKKMGYKIDSLPEFARFDIDTLNKDTAKISGLNPKDMTALREKRAELFEQYVERKQQLSLPQRLKEYFAYVFKEFLRVHNFVKLVDQQSFFDQIYYGKSKGEKTVIDQDFVSRMTRYETKNGKVYKTLETSDLEIMLEFGDNMPSYKAVEDIVEKETSTEKVEKIVVQRNELLKKRREIEKNFMESEQAASLVAKYENQVREYADVSKEVVSGIKNSTYFSKEKSVSDEMGSGFLMTKKGRSVVVESKRVRDYVERGYERGIEIDSLAAEAGFENGKQYLEDQLSRVVPIKPETAAKKLLSYTDKLYGQITSELARTEKLLQKAKDDKNSFYLGMRVGGDIMRKKYKEKLKLWKRRKDKVAAAKDFFGLSSRQFNAIGGNQNVQFMTDEEFEGFMNHIQVQAEKEILESQAREMVVAQIQDKELKKTNNLRKAMKLPPIAEMNLKQLQEFDRALESTQFGDEFFTQRQLETVENTELKGIRTLREAREKLAEKIGVENMEVGSVVVSPTMDRVRYDTALAEKDPFYKMMVDETNLSMLEAGARFLPIEKVANDLIKKARNSRPRSIIEKLIPTDKIIFQYLESPNKEVLAKEMTNQELEAAEYIRRKFEEMRDYLLATQTLKSARENYITHIRRDFFETWKEDGFAAAFKEMFEQQQEDAATFEILSGETGEILPLEKFFQFSLRRTGELKPSENVAKAFLAYTRTFEKKRALDSLIPKLDIFVYSLTPKQMTDKGLIMDRSLKKFVNTWINNKKGRRFDFGGFLKQGGKADITIRSLRFFTTIIDLGLSIPGGVASNFGEQSANYAMLGNKKFSKGIAHALTPKGRRIVDKYRNFTGKNPWKELGEVSRNTGDKFFEALFILFRDSQVRANRQYLLGSLTKEEWEAETISPTRLADMQRDMGRWRVVEGSKSIVGSTSPGSVATQYKSWAIPILRTVAKDTAYLLKTRDFKSKEGAEMLRSVIVVGGLGLIIMAILGDNEDDDTFMGNVIKRSTRDLLSTFGALDPTFILGEPRVFPFLKNLAAGLKQIIFWETYKTTGKGYDEGDLKGINTIKRAIKPASVRQFENKESSSSSPKTYQDILKDARGSSGVKSYSQLLKEAQK